MINALMFGALGFFLGCLLALMLAPPLWNRAVKLTTRKLEATMPMSLSDIQADKDQLRAEFAIELRKVEVALEKAKEKATRELIEANKRRVEIAVLNTDLATVKGQLQENENANRVLQQTIKRRLPDLDTRLKAAKKALAELEQVNGELRATVASQSDALKTARTTLHNQRSDIERLRMALEAGGGGGMRGGKADARTLAESQRLTAELSKAQEQLERAKTGAEENMLLRRELSKLASQILTVTRTQGMAQVQQPRMVVEVTQAYVEPSAIDELQAPREEPEETEQWQSAHAGNGAAHEPEAPEMEADAPELDGLAAGMSLAEVETAEPEDAAEDDADSDEAKGSFARRFVARREARRARKSGGSSLSARLRGLVDG
jgi:DNA repair exonuclease SbcCD ATPase subunit